MSQVQSPGQPPTQAASASTSPIRNEYFDVGFATDIGRRRSQNQDNFAVVPELGLFLIADGMGGHQGGEIASAIVAEVVPKVVREFVHGEKIENPGQALTHAIQEANRAIFEHSQQHSILQGMGTTTTALLFQNGVLTIGHVGDSRCYFLQPAGTEYQLWQATRDHSLVQEKLRAGLITRDEIKTDRMKNVITRSVGFEPEVAVELYELKPEAGDAFLICSDGLSGMIDDTGIRKIVTEGLLKKKDVGQTVRNLIAQANQNGGEDNVTTVVVQVNRVK